MMRRLSGAFAALALSLLWQADQAWADAIDGTWCSKDGRNMIIDGAAITTPGGTRMTGNYGRHSFDYTIPEKEAHAGAKVLMTLVNETTIHLKIEIADAMLEVWRRCDLTA